MAALSLCTWLSRFCSCCLVTKSRLAHCGPWTIAHQSPLSSTVSQSLLKFTSIKSVMVSNHLIFCHPLLLLPSIFPSHQVFFQRVGSSHQMVKVLKLQLQHQSLQRIFRLISFRIDWFDLLAVQGTLKSLLQQHNSKVSILRCSALFMVHLSDPYMTTGKTIDLTRRTFVGKVTSLLFKMLSRLVILFFQEESIF